jgi:hypothetical protein
MVSISKDAASNCRPLGTLLPGVNIDIYDYFCLVVYVYDSDMK